MRFAAEDLDYLDHMWRMTNAEPVWGVKNGKVGEKVLKHDNLGTRSSIFTMRRTRGVGRTSTTNEYLMCMPRGL